VFDVDHVETLLQAAAARRSTFTYSELLQQLGAGFSRPRLRALCAVLDVIDVRAEAAGQPELAGLVVRESDRLPGQGWWTARHDYIGAWEGPEAGAYLRSVQRTAFDYWKSRGAAEPEV
jgi:hypothetical protein